MWRHIKLLEQVLMLGRGEAVTGKENEGGFRAASNIYRRRQWHPTPVLLPGKSHGRRSLGGCSPWGREELDRTEWLHFHFSLLCIGEGNGNPLQCSCLENPRDGVAQSRTRLKWLSSSSSNNIYFLCRSRGVCVRACMRACVLGAQSCLTLCNPMERMDSIWKNSLSFIHLWHMYFLYCILYTSIKSYTHEIWKIYI